MIGIRPVSRPARFRVAGGLILLGLVIEVWTLFQVNAVGFMLFLAGGLVPIGLGVALNVYWVSLELSTRGQGGTPPQGRDSP